MPPPPDARTQEQMAQQKLEAEIAKIRQETKKLELESDALLAHEIIHDRAKAELNRVESEVAKLVRENETFRNGMRLEWIKAIGSLSSVFLGIAAIGGLIVSLQTSQLASQRAEAEAERARIESFSALIRELVSEHPLNRASAANRVSVYSSSETYSKQAISSLINAFAFEKNPLAQDALLNSIRSINKVEYIKSELSLIKGQISRATERLFSRVDTTTGLPNRDVSEEVDIQQQAMIKITIALSESPLCEKDNCVADFRNMKSLRRASFFLYNDRLKGANFTDASLSEADLYKVDLSGASFQRSVLDGTNFAGAILAHTNFANSMMRKVNNRIRGPLQLAVFKGANLDGAIFTNACLAGADFRGAINVDLSALRSGFTEGILIEPEKLAQIGTPRGSPACAQVDE